MEKVEYPAVFVLSARRQDPRTGEPYITAFADGKELHNDKEMGRRVDQFTYLEETGGLGYTYTLANVDDVEQVIAERKAELEAELTGDYAGAVEAFEEAEDARPVSPAPEPPSREPTGNHSSTNGAISQLLRLGDIEAIRQVWGDPYCTDLDMKFGGKVRITIPYSEAATAARGMGWMEPVKSSGYWMRP